MSGAPMERWRGRVALVTGASSGIGRAVASALCSDGMKVVVSARRGRSHLRAFPRPPTRGRGRHGALRALEPGPRAGPRPPREADEAGKLRFLTPAALLLVVGAAVGCPSADPCAAACEHAASVSADYFAAAGGLDREALGGREPLMSERCEAHCQEGRLDRDCLRKAETFKDLTRCAKR